MKINLNNQNKQKMMLLIYLLNELFQHKQPIRILLNYTIKQQIKLNQMIVNIVQEHLNQIKYVLLIIKFMNVHHQKANNKHNIDLNHINIVQIVYHFVVQVMIYKINNYENMNILQMKHGWKLDKNIGQIY
jgi:hypothetical protein